MSALSGYRPDVDGLRTIAVGTVVAFHAGIGWLPGGFVGVDVFFVISGFLITSIIAREAQAGTYSLLTFYERRIRRIFPALFVMLAATAAAAWMLLPPAELKLFGQSLASAIFFLSNVQQMLDTGYFAGAAETRPLLHTWSLAVEEQFYIFFPPLLAWLIVRRRRMVVPLMILAILASFAASVVATQLRPSGAFYLAPFRAWELGVGALLALTPTPKLPRGASSVLGVVGLALIGWAVFAIDDTVDFPGVAAAAPVLGAAALILAGMTGGGPVTALLSLRPMVAVGLISYSLYLWHWPVLVFLRYWTVRPPTGAEILAAVALSALLAWASWRFVERPFRKPGLIATRAGALRFGGALMAGGVAVAAAMLATGGAPSRFSPEALAALEQVEGRARFENCGPLVATAKGRGDVCPLGAAGAPDFAVWGDSHAEALSPAFDAAGKAAGRAGVLLKLRGCPPLLDLSQSRAPFDDCGRGSTLALDYFDAHPGIREVILVGRWAIYADGTRFLDEPGPMVFMRDSQSTTLGVDENRAAFARAAERTVTELRARGLEVVVVGQAPEAEVNVPEARALALKLGRALSLGASRAEYDARQANALAAFAPLLTQDGVRFLPLADAFCSDGRCRVLDEAGLPLYSDSNHLAEGAARSLASVVAPALVAQD